MERRFEYLACTKHPAAARSVFACGCRAAFPMHWYQPLLPTLPAGASQIAESFTTLLVPVYVKKAGSLQVLSVCAKLANYKGKLFAFSCSNQIPRWWVVRIVSREKDLKKQPKHQNSLTQPRAYFRKQNMPTFYILVNLPHYFYSQVEHEAYGSVPFQ